MMLFLRTLKMWSFVIFMVLGAISTVFGAEDTIERILEAGKLRVGVVMEDYPPFIITGKNGELKGYDIDLARSIADELGVLCEFIRTAETWDALVGQAASGEVDFSVSGISTTLVRARGILYSSPYTSMLEAVVVNRVRMAQKGINSAVSMERLNTPDMHIAVPQGTVYVPHAARLLPEAQKTYTASFDAAVDMVRQGKVDAAYLDEVTARRIFLDDPEQAIILEYWLFPERKDHYGIALSRSHRHLADWLEIYLRLHPERPGINDLFERYLTLPDDSAIKLGSGQYLPLKTGVLLAVACCVIMLLASRAGNSVITVLQGQWIGIAGLGLGILIGVMDRPWAMSMAPAGNLYFSLLQMCILPLIMTAIISNVGRLFTAANAVRVFRRVTLVFSCALSLGALTGGMTANLMKPGAEISDKALNLMGRTILEGQSSSAVGSLDGSSAGGGLAEFLQQVIPENIFASLSEGNIVPIIFFAIFLGVALARKSSVSKRTALEVADECYAAFSRMLDWILCGLPFGLCLLVANLVATIDGEIFFTLGRYVAGLVLCFTILCLLSSIVFWRCSGGSYVDSILSLRRALLIVLGTSSSLAALPFALDALKSKLSYGKDVVTVVLPVGITLNAVACTAYYAFSSVFIAQIYSVELSFGQLPVIFLGAIMAGIGGMFAPAVAAVLYIGIILIPLGLPLSAAVTLLTPLFLIINPFMSMSNIYCNCASTALIASVEVSEKIE